MAATEKLLRTGIVAQCRRMNGLGLNQGTAGNISARNGRTMLITPSAMPYDALQPDMIAAMPLDGEYGAWKGRFKPSSEWRFHLDIMRARDDVGAIVHTHAVHCTALAMAHRSIPAAHYMIALFGGPIVKCTPYAPYGTKDLSDLALAGLEDRHAVLLGNHGAITLGATLDQAMHRMMELETLARMYLLSLAAGKPKLLSDVEISITVERFKSYGVGLGAPAAKAARGKAASEKKKSTSKASTRAGGKPR